jgi:hypothetical protein
MDAAGNPSSATIMHAAVGTMIGVADVAGMVVVLISDQSKLANYLPPSFSLSSTLSGPPSAPSAIIPMPNLSQDYAKPDPLFFAVNEYRGDSRPDNENACWYDLGLLQGVPRGVEASCSWKDQVPLL